MDPRPPGESDVDRLRIALRLYRTGVAMKRQSLRREHPGISDFDLERLLIAWIRQRPGAELGDAEGIVTDRRIA